MGIKQKSRIAFFIAILNNLIIFAQQQDDIIIEVSHTLERDSDADLINYRTNVKVYSKALKDNKGLFSVRLIAEQSNLNYNILMLQANDLERFYNFGIDLSYFKVLNQKWSVIGVLRPQLSSNFTSDITLDDFNPNAALIFNYSNKLTYRLSFGASYVANSPLGFPLLPYFNYWQKLGKKTEMNLGIYESSFSYKISKGTTLSAFFGFDGFNYNINDNLIVGNKKAESINFVETRTGLRLNQKLSKTIKFNLNTGYTLSRNLDFLDDSQNEVTSFDIKNNLSLSAGISINFDNKKRKQKRND